MSDEKSRMEIGGEVDFSEHPTGLSRSLRAIIAAPFIIFGGLWATDAYLERMDADIEKQRQEIRVIESESKRLFDALPPERRPGGSALGANLAPGK
jgi:hypothetical protein